MMTGGGKAFTGGRAEGDRARQPRLAASLAWRTIDKVDFNWMSDQCTPKQTEEATHR